MSVTSRTMKTVLLGNKSIGIAVAEYVRGKDSKRQIDAIDKKLLQTVVDNVATAVTGSDSGLTEEQKKSTSQVVVQYASN